MTDRLPPGLRFTKGHGTENDFVLLADPDAHLDLTPELVRALCDRRAGVGADGVIRAVRTAALAALDPTVGPGTGAEWFMDYRNADGSIAEMCGNGIRVHASFLLASGLVPAGTRAMAIGTRGGVCTVRAVGDDWAVDMGRWYAPGGQQALEAGYDVTVRLAGEQVARPGLRIDMPNPHVVLALPDVHALAAADLGEPPEVHPRPAEGTNVELVAVLGEDRADGAAVGRIRMRVHERGVGETRSCGTGTCAAAVAVARWAGEGAPGVWDVEVPGGVVRVTLGPDRAVELCGPAVLVADGVTR